MENHILLLKWRVFENYTLLKNGKISKSHIFNKKKVFENYTFLLGDVFKLYTFFYSKEEIITVKWESFQKLHNFIKLGSSQKMLFESEYFSKDISFLFKSGKFLKMSIYSNGGIFENLIFYLGCKINKNYVFYLDWKISKNCIFNSNRKITVLPKINTSILSKYYIYQNPQ